MSDPPFDPADQALLDQAVRGLQDDLPDDARMRRLERMIATPTAPQRWWTPARAAVGMAIVVVASGAWIATRRPPEAPPPVAVPVVVTAPEAPVVEPVTPVVSVDSLPTAPEPPVTAKRAPDPPRAEAPAEDPGDELALLEDARRSLAADPSRTLALADAHAKRFRKPALAQERERLAIDALVRLGRHAEAETRARAFEAAYPDSPHLARVRALVGEAP